MDPLFAFISGMVASLGLGGGGAWYYFKHYKPQPDHAPVIPANHSLDQAVLDASLESEEQFIALLDAMPSPVWLRDPHLNVAFANRAATQGDTNTLNLPEISHALAELAISKGGAQSKVFQIDTNTGQLTLQRTLEITETPLGPGLGSMGICMDKETTSQSTLQSTLQSRVEAGTILDNAALDRLLESLHAGVAIYGADKRLHSFNSAFANLWSLNEAWLAESPTLTQVLERLRDERLLPEVSNFTDFRAQENNRFLSPTPFEETLYLPDGRAVKLTITPGAAGAAGAPGAAGTTGATGATSAPESRGEGGLTYIYEDITEALIAQRSFKSLDAVQRHTIDNLQEAVALFGSDSRLKLHNAPFAKLWGLAAVADQNEPHLSDVVDLMREKHEDDATWASRRDQIMANLLRRQNHQDRIRRADGNVYDLSCVPLPDGALLISYLDVTDKDEVEQALRERAEILEETDRLKSKFIADVSYEARTPLTTINGFAQIMNEEYFGDLNARQKEYVQGIHQTSESLQLIIADILELAAIESGTAHLNKDAIDLHGLLAQSLAMFKQRALAKSLYITFDVPTDIGWISADEKRLKQVVFNLLSNAIRFTPERGGVRISAERQDDMITFSVSDTGTGIPQADIERFFQKFEKGSQPQGELAGAGLGLSMVKSFIELHGGQVTIKSPRNRGTTVSCILPATGTEGGDARDAFEI